MQYQFVVPDGQEQALVRILERVSSERLPCFLAVLKRFGPGNDGLLSFPRPAGPSRTTCRRTPTLAPLLDELDERVVDAGGRVYLAKDARLRPEVLAAMYPRLASFRAVRDRVDPDRVFQSDLSRRLAI